MLGNSSWFYCGLLFFFQNQLFQSILSGTLSECQMVWIQIRTIALSVLIWVQTVFKDYQLTARKESSLLGDKSKSHLPCTGYVLFSKNTIRVSNGFEQSKLSAKVISRRKKSPLAGKELILFYQSQQQK